MPLDAGSYLCNNFTYVSLTMGRCGTCGDWPRSYRRLVTVVSKFAVAVVPFVCFPTRVLKFTAALRGVAPRIVLMVASARSGVLWR